MKASAVKCCSSPEKIHFGHLKRNVVNMLKSEVWFHHTVLNVSKKPMTLKVDIQHWVLEYNQVCSNDDPGLTLTYFTARSNLVPYAFVWEKGNIMDFSETIVVHDIKVGRFFQLNESMSFYEYQRSRSFIDLCPRSLRFNIFKLLLLGNH